MTAQIPLVPPLFQTQLAFPFNPGDPNFTLASPLMLNGVPLVGLVCMSIDIGNTNPEYVVGTLAGTVVTVVLRNVDPLAPDTAGPMPLGPHRRGAPVKITDFSTICLIRNILEGITALQHVLKSPVDAVNPDEVPNYGQLAGAIIAGGIPATNLLLGLTRLTVPADTILGTCVISIASPAVITLANHGLIVGDIVKFSTSGSLPTGITAGAPYFVIAAGLTANDFEISATSGGPAIVTTGTQSGVQTLIRSTPIVPGTNDPRIPTLDEAQALPGAGSPPNTTNPYETLSDTTDGNTTDQSQLTQDISEAVGEADATTKHVLLAQSFVAGQSPIVAVELNKQADTGAFAGTVKISIVADVAGAPSGPDLASVTVANGPWLALSPGANIFTFSSQFITVTGTTYWIVITPSTNDNANHINIGANSAGGYASGVTKYFDTADGWTLIAVIDLYFRTITSTGGKLARFQLNGQLKVEDTPVAGTDATSKDYVDSSILPVTNSQSYSVNADEKIFNWFTYQAPFLSDSGTNRFVGWQCANTTVLASYGAGGYAIFDCNGANATFSNFIAGTNGTSTSYEWADAKGIRLKMKADMASANIHSIGLTGNSAPGFLADETSTAENIRFVANAGTLYAVNGNGASNTRTSLGAYTTKWQLYEIVFTPGVDIKFYINGILVATHTTNLPTSATPVMVGGGSDTNATSIFLAPFVISIEQ